MGLAFLRSWSQNASVWYTLRHRGPVAKPYKKIVVETISAERERELVHAMRAGDEGALHKLVVQHRPLVFMMAKRYTRSGVVLEDLVSEGFVALCVAAQRFDPAFGTRFNTYARWWVRYYMTKFSFDTRSIVRPPMDRAARRARQKLTRVAHELGGQLGREPTREELATALETTPDIVRIVQMERMGRDIPVGTHEESNAHGLHEPVATSDVEAEAAELEELRRLDAVDDAVDALLPREQEVIRRRFFSTGETLRGIGEEMGVSGERVRQIERQAISKLHQILRPGTTIKCTRCSSEFKTKDELFRHNRKMHWGRRAAELELIDAAE
jgi:RNA polymerase sigma factor (sigma-70 family)